MATVKKTIRKQRGNPNLKAGPGRPKGKPNKITATVKQALEECFHELGGARWLVKVAKEDPKPIIVLLGKLIPNVVQAELTGKDGAPLGVKDMSDEELLAIIEKAKKRE